MSLSPSLSPACPTGTPTLPPARLAAAPAPAAPAPAAADLPALPGGSLETFVALATAAHRVLAPVVPALGEMMTLVAKVRTTCAAHAYGRRTFSLGAARDAADAHRHLDTALAALADIERALRDARAALSAPAEVLADAAGDPAHVRHSDLWGQSRALIIAGVADEMGLRRPSPARFNELTAEMIAETIAETLGQLREGGL